MEMEDGSAERADLFVAAEKTEPLQSPPGSPKAKQSNQSSSLSKSISDGEDAHGSTSLPMQIPERRKALTPTSPAPGFNALMNNQRVSASTARQLQYTPSSPGGGHSLDEEPENDLFFSLDSLTLQDDSSTSPTACFSDSKEAASSGFIDNETWITWSGDSGDSSMTADMVRTQPLPASPAYCGRERASDLVSLFRTVFILSFSFFQRIIVYSVIGSKEGRIQIKTLTKLLPSDIVNRVVERSGSLSRLVELHPHIFCPVSAT
jgi:hypothetical protein